VQGISWRRATGASNACDDVVFRGALPSAGSRPDGGFARSEDYVFYKGTPKAIRVQVWRDADRSVSRAVAYTRRQGEWTLRARYDVSAHNGALCSEVGVQRYLFGRQASSEDYTLTGSSLGSH